MTLAKDSSELAKSFIDASLKTRARQGGGDRVGVDEEVEGLVHGQGKREGALQDHRVSSKLPGQEAQPSGSRV